MGIRKKYRRKIIYNGMEYMWYIKNGYCDLNFERNVLHIISKDKKMILLYPLEANPSFVVSQGQMFQNYKGSGSWQRYLCPYEGVFPITPKFVVKLIHWAINGSDGIAVTYDGKDIWL